MHQDTIAAIDAAILELSRRLHDWHEGHRLAVDHLRVVTDARDRRAADLEALRHTRCVLISLGHPDDIDFDFGAFAEPADASEFDFDFPSPATADDFDSEERAEFLRQLIDDEEG